jgi:hypothetical protein
VTVETGKLAPSLRRYDRTWLTNDLIGAFRQFWRLNHIEFRAAVATAVHGEHPLGEPQAGRRRRRTRGHRHW